MDQQRDHSWCQGGNDECGVGCQLWSGLLCTHELQGAPLTCSHQQRRDWIAPRYIMEVERMEFVNGLNVRGKEERGTQKNASWAPDLNSREGEELEEEKEESVKF